MHAVSPTTPPRWATGLPRLRLNFGDSLKSSALLFFFWASISLYQGTLGVMFDASISTVGGVYGNVLIWVFIIGISGSVSG